MEGHFSKRELEKSRGNSKSKRRDRAQNMADSTVEKEKECGTRNLMTEVSQKQELGQSVMRQNRADIDLKPRPGR